MILNQSQAFLILEEFIESDDRFLLPEATGSDGPAFAAAFCKPASHVSINA